MTTTTDKLAAALRDLTSYIDVSTIRSGKRVEAEWTRRADNARAALAAYASAEQQSKEEQ